MCAARKGRFVLKTRGILARGLANRLTRASAMLALWPLALHAQSAPTPSDAPSQSPAPAPAAPAPTPSFASAGPVELTAVLDLDLVSDLFGGIKPGTKGMTKAALSASYQGSDDGHEGLTALASIQYIGGGRPSAHNVGDIQGFDNIEAASALRIYELWAAHDYAEGRLGWKLGLTDLNADFDTQQVAGLFLNSSDGVGAELGHSGVNGPSIFPTTALAVSGFFRPDPSLVFRAGIFDGTAGSPTAPGAFAIRLSGKDGALFIGQVEKITAGGTRVEGGAWAYTARFDALDRVDAAGNPQRLARERGAYALVETTLTRSGDDGERGLSGWLRLGIGDPVVEQIHGYLGGGLVYTGPLAQRASDQAGVALNHAIVDQVGPPATPAARSGAETSFEATYRYVVRDWISVQPDTQLVVHPSGDAQIPTAYVIALRLNLTLTRELFQKLRGHS